MSSELNLGADHDQSKRLVNHWHNMWAKSQSALEAANAENKKLRAALEEISKLGGYAGKITPDIEQYLIKQTAMKAPEIAREALESK